MGVNFYFICIQIKLANPLYRMDIGVDVSFQCPMAMDTGVGIYDF